ncbi:HipA domain-containing protein [Candidatus Poriferisocius sp.]|uniref:HipA domain-containing protein n=1 Tax=Candidatus Poriferisocius sp. TaxID=3101276 RepID=UPI003B5B3B15
MTAAQTNRGGLVVLLGGRVAGTVRAGREGACWFSYASDYATDRAAAPLSLSIPLGEGEHDIADWMDGLLPARLEAREYWAARYGAFSDDPMDLLATKIGWDCAGAVQFCPPERLDEMASRTPGSVPLSEQELERRLEQLRAGMPPPAEAGPMAPFSLAGAQAKTVLCKTGDGSWAAPVGGAPSTHILKIALPGYPDTDLVEHVCMDALRRTGMPAARTEIVVAGRQRAIAVERYDRTAGGGVVVERVHQEDLCQALGFPSRFKFQRNGGPAVFDIAGLLNRAGSPGDTERFYDALACNWLLAADDAHAKNYSILLGAGETALAPLYDVCSKAPWAPPEIGEGGITLAMQIGTAWSVSEADLPQAWRDCAAEAGIDPDRAAERVSDLASRLPAALAAAIDSLPGPLADSQRIAALAALTEPRPDGMWGRHTRPQSPAPSRTGTPSAVVPVLPAGRRPTRCPHIGRRSRRRCNRPLGHRGPHTYDKR